MKTPTKFKYVNNSKENGFTVIEVLIVIVIASFLIMVSLPLYQNYAVRTKISGDFSLMHPLMLRMNEEYALNDKWPSSNAEAGAHESVHYKGKYLSSAEVSDNPQEGTMTLTYNADKLPVLRGTNTLVFYPSKSASGASWECDQGTIPPKYRPPNCQ